MEIISDEVVDKTSQQAGTSCSTNLKRQFMEDACSDMDSSAKRSVTEDMPGTFWLSYLDLPYSISLTKVFFFDIVFLAFDFLQQFKINILTFMNLKIICYKFNDRAVGFKSRSFACSCLK